MKHISILSAIILFCGIQLFSQQNYSKVRIYADKEELVKIQKLGIDIGNISGKPGIFIDTEISDYEIQKLSDNNLKYDILIKDMLTKLWQNLMK